MEKTKSFFSILGLGIAIGVTVTTILIYLLGATPKKVNVGGVEFEIPSPTPSSLTQNQQKTQTTQPEPTSVQHNDVPPTPIGIYNPSGIVQSNMPIYVDGYALSFRGISVDDYGYESNIIVKLSIKNVGERNRVFRYTGISITLRDDVGNMYPPFTHATKYCNETALYDTRQFNIDIGKEINLSSISNLGGCIENESGTNFPSFTGTMSPQAKSFFIGFKDFGSFTNFEIEVKP
jgi:hypothetical protein